MPRKREAGAKKELEIEVWERSPGALSGARNLSADRGVFRRISVGLDEFKEEISKTVRSLADAFKPGPGGPKSCEVTVGLKLTATGSVIIAAAGSDVSLSVKLTWE